MIKLNLDKLEKSESPILMPSISKSEISSANTKDENNKTKSVRRVFIRNL